MNFCYLVLCGNIALEPSWYIMENLSDRKKTTLMNTVYMKMPVSVRIFSSFVVPVPGMEVRKVAF